MTAHADDQAHETGHVQRAHHSGKIHTARGDTLPRCADGHKTVETRRDEPRDKS